MATKQKKIGTPRGLRVESLEDRRLMAGDVTAQLVNGTLTISEAPKHIGEASEVSVSKLSNGNIRVSSFKATTNGLSYVDFNPGSTVPNLKVNLGAGNDTLNVTGSLKFNAVDLIMNEISKASSTGSDNDIVNLNGLTTLGSLKISTGDGVDTVSIKQAHIGDGIGLTDVLDINTGKGADTVTLGDAISSLDVKGYAFIDTTSGRINGAVNLSELGDDRVSITSLSVTGSLNVETGGGNDTVEITGSYIGYRLNLVAGDGIDVAKMRDVTVQNAIIVDMGAGNDSLELHNVDTIYIPTSNTNTTDGSMQLDGGLGTDTLVVSLDCNSRLINRMNWEIL